MQQHNGSVVDVVD
jgi:hypothetical protein